MTNLTSDAKKKSVGMSSDPLTLKHNGDVVELHFDARKTNIVCFYKVHFVVSIF